jgi:tetratricopeptide (TPR) repeat protein
LCTIGNSYLLIGDYTQALNYQSQALEKAKLIGNRRAMSFVLNSIGDTYRIRGNYSKAIETYQHAIQVDEETHDISNQLINKGSMAEIYERLSNYSFAYNYAYNVLSATC